MVKQQHWLPLVQNEAWIGTKKESTCFSIVQVFGIQALITCVVKPWSMKFDLVIT
jgi:hypothetical protein